VVAPPVLEFNPAHWGATGALLLLFWKLLEVAMTLFRSRQQQQPAVAHQHRRLDDVDPLHEHQMEEVHERIMEGKLGCHWKDRDEVRDFIEALRAQTSSSKQQTAAIQALTAEIRLSRVNGGNGK
jgi:hypothetical protein